MIRRLIKMTRKFRLLQAIRLVEMQTIRAQIGRGRLQQIGSNSSPDQEPIRLGSVAKARFAGSEVEEISEEPAGNQPGFSNQLIRLQTSVMGLTGPTGVLPLHYTSLLLQRQKLHDNAMTDFYDIFNHRSLSIFYRAWAKQQIPVSYETSRLIGDRPDRITSLLNSLVGQGFSELQKRTPVPDQTLLMFASLFSSRRRTASGLENILRISMKIPVEVEQFQPQWLNLELEERTRLGSRDQEVIANNQLGRSAICGERVFDLQSRFRIVLTTASYLEFASFLPDQKKLKVIQELTRRYVGMEYDFDVQVKLSGKDVPACQLSREQKIPARLGRNSWLRSRSMTGTTGDAVFNIADSA